MTWRTNPKIKKTIPLKPNKAGERSSAQDLASVIHNAGQGRGSSTNPSPQNRRPAPTPAGPSTNTSQAGPAPAGPSVTIHSPPPSSMSSPITPRAPSKASRTPKKTRPRVNLKAKAKASAHLNALKKLRKPMAKRPIAFAKVQRAMVMDRTPAVLRMMPTALADTEECAGNCADKKINALDLVIQRTQAGIAKGGFTSKTVTYRHFSCRTPAQCLRFFDRKGIEDLDSRLSSQPLLSKKNKLEGITLPNPIAIIHHHTVRDAVWSQSVMLMLQGALDGLKEPTEVPSKKLPPRRKEQQSARSAIREVQKQRRKAELTRKRSGEGPEQAAARTKRLAKRQEQKRESRRLAREKKKDKGKGRAEGSGDPTNDDDDVNMGGIEQDAMDDQAD